MDQRKFREAMGKFTTGVTVVLTELNDYVYGTTVNAFMSVSINPFLILISLKNDSQTLLKIQESQSFSVNILASNQEDISNFFASKEKQTEVLTFDKLDSLPVIPKAIAQVSCAVSSEYIEGDHTLLVGKVTDISVTDGEPLIFSSGKYRKLEQNKVLQ